MAFFTILFTTHVGLKQHKDMHILFDQYLKLNFVVLETLLVNI